MLKKIAVTLVLALSVAVVEAPFGVLTATHAKPGAPKPPKPEDIFKDLRDATAHAKMKGGLRGKLMPLVDRAKRDWKAGRDEDAIAALLEYIARVEQEKGAGIDPAVADELIAAANALIDTLSPYPYAGDYDRVPIVSVSPEADPIDWRTKGAVTGVKDQLLCDASHAFSVTGAMEGSWQIETGTLVAMSEQQLIDCVADNEGCDGGSPVRAIEDVIDRGGIANVQSYPYTGIAGTCGFGTAFLIADFSAMSRPEPGDESALASFVSDNGPVSAVLRIRTTAWDSYTTGILDPPVQADSALRFIAVLIVGWGSSGGGDYWIVKTSEGTSFGNQGYVLIRRGINAFGIADFVVWPEA